MEPRDISNLQAIEAIELDAMLSKCASMIYAPYSDLGEEISSQKTRPKNSSLDVSEPDIDLVFQCYKQAGLLKTHPESIKTNLQRYKELNFNYQTEAKSRAKYYTQSYLQEDEQDKNNVLRRRIIAPVIAYTLLINNEFNDNTVRERMKSQREHDRIPDWQTLSAVHIHRAAGDTRSRDYKTMKEYLREILSQDSYYNLLREAEPHFPFIREIFDVLDRRALLLIYCLDGIMYQQEVSKIGFFLRDYLRKRLEDNSSDEKTVALDVILTLYLINETGGLLYRTANIASARLYDIYFIDPIEDRNPIISLFYFSRKAMTEDEKTITKQSHGETCFKSDNLGELYAHLKEHDAISKETALRLIDFYFDPSYLNLGEESLKWAKRYITFVIDKIKHRYEEPVIGEELTTAIYLLDKIIFLTAAAYSQRLAILGRAQMEIDKIMGDRKKGGAQRNANEKLDLIHQEITAEHCKYTPHGIDCWYCEYQNSDAAKQNFSCPSGNSMEGFLLASDLSVYRSCRSSGKYKAKKRREADEVDRVEGVK